MERRGFYAKREVTVIGQGTWYGGGDDRDVAIAALRRGLPGFQSSPVQRLTPRDSSGMRALSDAPWYGPARFPSAMEHDQAFPLGPPPRALPML
jgi:hypothetical protein